MGYLLYESKLLLAQDIAYRNQSYVRDYRERAPGTVALAFT